ncbi:hypothetical protein HPB51_025551 [Rhipicephalus microplus]|uniref:Uncharacterized protein n=1 Tax=Rhipicephalus microplus TaxID=6941 RepID=A0A9J6F981_RHIMP|nr:hypothetical protein HPB51_025551 [Rhipicephalus microplus]
MVLLGRQLTGHGCSGFSRLKSVATGKLAGVQHGRSVSILYHSSRRRPFRLFSSSLFSAACRSACQIVAAATEECAEAIQVEVLLQREAGAPTTRCPLGLARISAERATCDQRRPDASYRLASSIDRRRSIGSAAASSRPPLAALTNTNSSEQLPRLPDSACTPHFFIFSLPSK